MKGHCVVNLDSFVLGPELPLRQMNARSAHDGGRDLSKERTAILSPLQPIANTYPIACVYTYIVRLIRVIHLNS